MAPPRLHVVGSSPRSGTTLMFELLTSCFDLAKLGDHEASLFERPPPDLDKAFASKSPMEFIHVARVLRWKPKLFSIYMERDPRDVVVSRHGSRPDEYWCDFHVWRRNNALLTRFGEHPRLIVCRYEDLVADPDREQARIEERFAFLQRTNRFSDFDKVGVVSAGAERALKGVRSISTSSVGSWRQHLPRVCAQLAQSPDMPGLIVRAGYETDETWTASCQGVAPSQALSVRSASDPMRNRSRVTRLAARLPRRLRTAAAELRYLVSRRN